MKLVSVLLLIASAVITTAYDYSLDGHKLRRGAPSDSEIDNEIEPEEESRHLNEDVLLTGINGRIPTPTTRSVGYKYGDYSGYEYGEHHYYGHHSKSSKSSKSSKKHKGHKGAKGHKGNKGAKYYKKHAEYGYEYGYSEKYTKPYH